MERSILVDSDSNKIEVHNLIKGLATLDKIKREVIRHQLSRKARWTESCWVVRCVVANFPSISSPDAAAFCCDGNSVFEAAEEQEAGSCERPQIFAFALVSLIMNQRVQ